jgi:hypothetical protein
MALNLDGGRKLFWARPGNDIPNKSEKFRLRPAAHTDVALLADLYEIHCRRSLIYNQRSRQEWEYGMFGASSGTPGRLRAHIIENEDGQGVAYVHYWPWATNFIVREMGVIPGISWREIGLFLVRQLKKEADVINRDREEKITNIHFNFGETHPVYDALGKQLERLRKPYAWYVRIPDLKQFLLIIAPVLEKRLAQSVVAGYEGMLRLNNFHENLTIQFEKGRLTEIGTYEAQYVEDADAFFPDKTFFQLLLGYRSLDELDYAFADCYADNEEAAVLLRALFPRHPSDITPL